MVRMTVTVKVTENVTIKVGNDSYFGPGSD